MATSRNNIHDAFASETLLTRVNWCISIVTEIAEERGKFYSLAEGIHQRLQPGEDGLSADHVSEGIANVLSELLGDVGTEYRLRDMLEGIKNELTGTAGGGSMNTEHKEATRAEFEFWQKTGVTSAMLAELGFTQRELFKKIIELKPHIRGWIMASMTALTKNEITTEQLDAILPTARDLDPATTPTQFVALVKAAH